MNISFNPAKAYVNTKNTLVTLKEARERNARIPQNVINEQCTDDTLGILKPFQSTKYNDFTFQPVYMYDSNGTYYTLKLNNGITI